MRGRGRGGGPKRKGSKRKFRGEGREEGLKGEERGGKNKEQKGGMEGMWKIGGVKRRKRREVLNKREAKIS